MSEVTHDEEHMYKVNPTIIYVDQEELQKAADKNALDEYMRGESGNKRSNIECLFQKRLHTIAKTEMSKLPEKSQQLLHLRFWKDLTDEEISVQLHLGESDVGILLSSTLKDLKKNIIQALKLQYRFHTREFLCSND